MDASAIQCAHCSVNGPVQFYDCIFNKTTRKQFTSSSYAIHDFGGISEYFKFWIIALEIKWYYRVTYGGIGDVIDYFSFGLVE